MILDKPYIKDSFLDFLNDFLPDYASDERPTRISDGSILSQVIKLGVSKDLNLTVLDIECEEGDNNRRIAITQAAFKVLRDHGIRNALIAFHDSSNQWRLSLLTSTLDLQNGKVVKKESNPRRYSYLLGVGAKTVTPYKYLVEKGRVEDIKQLQERFSVEVVNKQFYASIAELFTKLIGGERGATKYPGLLKLNGSVSQNIEHQEFAVRLIGRVIFSWFLKEKKSAAGVPIVPNELLSLDAVASNADYYHSILEPLFFELLNKRVEQRHENLREAPFSTVPYLNGGLFSPQYNDFYSQSSYSGTGTPGLIHIPDNWFTELFTVLEQYNFTVDENTSYDVDLSIDPEMLGRIFENLLAEINPETGESARKSTGSFYTPREIVNYMVDSSLLEFLKSSTGIDEEKLRALVSWGKDDDELHPLTDNENEKIVKALANLTILDPACGSGAFPIGILQKVVYVLQQVDEKAELWLQNQLKSITSPELRRDIEEKYRNENYDYLRKLGVIRESIFGVDIQTIATEISKLRCFLTLVIEEDVDDSAQNRGIRPLPNLDFKFVTANSLMGLPASNKNGKLNLFEDTSHIDRLKEIRNRYFGADADERARLQVEFKDLQLTMFKSRLASMGATSDLYNVLSDWNPFSHEKTEWLDAEWMFGLEGFDIVIGNPPYNASFTKDEREFYKKSYKSVSSGRQDSAAIFVELAKRLGYADSINAYIIPYRLYSRVRNHGAFQKYNLENFSIKQILYLGSNIGFTANDEFMVVVQSTMPNVDNVIQVAFKPELSGAIKFTSVEQKLFVDQSEINLNIAKYDSDLINKITASGVPLNTICDAKDGIVPYIRKQLVADSKLDGRYVPFAGVSGKYKLEKYNFDKGNLWLCYDINEAKKYISDPTELRKVQLRDKGVFLHRKIVSSQNSSILKASIDEEQTFLSNSIHSIYLNDEYSNQVSLEYVLGCFNSTLINYYHNFLRKKATDLHPQILLGDLKKLPYILPTSDNMHQVKEIESQVKQLLSDNEQDKDALLTNINQLVYQLYGLTPEEIAIIEDSIKK